MSVVIPGAMRATRPAFRFPGVLSTREPVLREEFSYNTPGALSAVWSVTGVGPYDWRTSGNVFYDLITPEAELAARMSGGGAAVDATATRVVGGLVPGARYDLEVGAYLWGVYAPFPNLYVGANGTEARVPYYNTRGPAMIVPVDADAAGELALTIRYAIGGESAWWGYVDYIEVTRPVDAPDRLLRFGYPLDVAVGGSTPHEATRWAARMEGGRAGWLVGVDRVLAGAARWIPAVNGTTAEGRPVSGWHGSAQGQAGWAELLAAGWAGEVLTYYPDQDDLSVSYPVTLRAPAPSPGEPCYALEVDGTRRVELVLESAAGPFLGY